MSPIEKYRRGIMITGNSSIEYEVRQGIGYIKLLPGSKGLFILTREVIADFSQAVSKCKEDASCQAVIITGVGEKAFCAGANIDVFQETGQEAVKAVDWAHYGQDSFKVLRELRKPSIAAVNGLALGGGFEIALSCTFRLASQNAKFGLTEMTLGFIPGWGGTQLLPRLVGKTIATELILTGEIIDAEKALQFGIVSDVVSQEELIPKCEALANRIIKNSPISVKLGLEAIELGLDLTLDQALELEANLAGISCTSAEAKERVSAFLEKRKRKS